MRRLYTIAVVILISSSFIKAQETSSPVFSLAGQIDYGFLLGHHPEMQRLSTRHFASFKLFFAHQTTGKKAWHQHYNFPEIGIGVYYTPLMNTDELGNAFALFGYFDRSFGKNKRKSFHFKFGFGPGIITSKFNAESNNQNMAIGTNLNIFVMFELQKEFQISNKIGLNLGIGIAHFSNTGYQNPNLGINLPSIQLGLKYYIGELELVTEEFETPKTKYFTHEMLLSYGKRQSSVEKAKNSVYNFRYQPFYTFTFKSAVIGSADLFFNIADNYSYESEATEDFFQAGIAIGYLLNLDQIQFMLQWGYYLYNKNPEFYPYYTRVGVKWVATEHFLVNLSLRTEWARALNAELGIGWRF